MARGAVMPPASAGNPSWRERIGALRHIPRFLGAVWRTSPSLTLASLLLRLVRAVLPVAVLFIGKLIIDEVVSQTQVAPPGDGSLGAWWDSGRLGHLGLLLAIEFGLAVASDVLARLVSLTDGLLSELYNNRVSVELIEHAASLDLEHFESSDQQDRLERARRQTIGRNALLPMVLGQVQDLLTIISFAAGLLIYAPSLILLLAVALVPSFLSESHFNTAAYRLSFTRSRERRRLEYIRFVSSSVETAKEIKLFRLADFLVARFREIAAAIFAANRDLAMRRALWGSVFAALSSVAYYLAYAVIAWRTVKGEYSIGDLSFLAASFLRLRGLLEGMLLGLSSIAAQALYLEDLFSFLETAPVIGAGRGRLPFPTPIRQGLAFEDVGFRYPESDAWAVRHLSFTLAAGEVIALVGENGAGKTTIVKLITRLYDPTEGRVLLDGIDLRDYDLDDLRRHVGVIFQDFVRYNLTVAENIAMGRIEAAGERERIHDAAVRSMADPIIARLPGGYDQLLGKRFSDGLELSGGEWQKIAIARAYMRDAALLILDEPTSALDARSEFEVFQRFKDLSEGKTAVLVSHRFSTVRMADRILVLEQGRVAESGTHAELLGLGGRYAELFELQASGYR